MNQLPEIPMWTETEFDPQVGDWINLPVTHSRFQRFVAWVTRRELPYTRMFRITKVTKDVIYYEA